MFYVAQVKYLDCRCTNNYEPHTLRRPYFLKLVRSVAIHGSTEELSHHFSRLVAASFDVFGTNSIAVWEFSFLKFAN